MKNFDSRVYSVNDFVEWDQSKQLQLNPTFQRRPVWSDKAKSFLIDTMIRGKPIPKVFIRQKLNVTTRTSMREVVDGQQRLRSILSFVKDGFVINRQHNEDFGGLRFSQLPEDVRGQFLQFEIAVDILINLPDSEILDIFSRLNSYAVVLNEQERINAEHFGPFKTLADFLGRKYQEYWTKNKILTDNQILRMGEVSLVADILIAMIEGVKPKKQLKRYYTQYEETFSADVIDLADRFEAVIITIARMFPEGLAETEFRRPHLFYSLFIAVAHCLVALPSFMVEPLELRTEQQIEWARNGLDRIGTIFQTEDVGVLQVDERTFLQDSRRATTDGPVRERRAKYLLCLMNPMLS